ncbi:MAG TPA: ParA family protein [Anaerolineae bacterium]|nr:ParA family protein [Anaerolineae bacterium]
MYKIAIATMKGGVGKTATTHALATALADKYRVLMVDIDPQSSLTASCGHQAGEASLAAVLDGEMKINEILVEVAPNLWLAPADIALATTELFITARMGRENLLHRALKDVGGEFDLCLIDSPPSLGLLTVNALRTATAVLIPTIPQITDLRGLNLFMGTLNQIRVELNPELEVMGILPTFFDGRLIHHREAIEVMREAGLPLLEVRIGRSVRVAEAAAGGESVVTYDPQNKQAKAYRQLAEEVDQWLKDELE